jgi:hypothetical protein
LAAKGAPIAIILNAGEYGLGVYGSSGELWKQDPTILADKGGEIWYDYISRKKGRFESFISDAVRNAVPDRSLYVYYTAGGGTHRNKDAFYKEWQYYPQALMGISDLPSNEVYYNHFNDGFTGRLDVLTAALNAVANEIKMGHPFSYNWISAGWGEKGNADLERWGGFLTCYFSAGMLGCNDGYYRFPEDRFTASFPEDAPPRWLLQMICTARTQARMSHLEHFIRNSELLPGPMRHALSKDDPAYEFPTGDKNARVLVRKKKQSPEWLITAWAADGAERRVEVTVPELGTVTVTASPAANLYSAVIKNDEPRTVKLEQPAPKQ